MQPETDTRQSSLKPRLNRDAEPGNTDLVMTPDGERTRIDQLNTGAKVEPEAEEQQVSGLRRWWRNLNMVLAGMYTGLGCYGTPNKHHSYSQDSKTDADKPDSRPL